MCQLNEWASLLTRVLVFVFIQDFVDSASLVSPAHQITVKTHF
jgi:hypothetical protein